MKLKGKDGRTNLRIWRCLWVLENIVEIMHKTDSDMR